MRARRLTAEEQTVVRPEVDWPLVYEPEGDRSLAALVAWCVAERSTLADQLHERGALLFRGFSVGSTAGFRAVLDALGQNPPNFAYAGNTLRPQTGQNIATVSYAPDWSTIFPHNEMFYWFVQPTTISFFCERTQCQYGETPLIDCRKVYEALPRSTREVLDRTRFATVSTFASAGSGAANPLSAGTQLQNTWQAVCGSTRREDFEAFVGAGRYPLRWRRDGSVQVTIDNPNVMTQPGTGRRCVRCPGVDPVRLQRQFNREVLGRLGAGHRIRAHSMNGVLTAVARVQRRLELVGGVLTRRQRTQINALMWEHCALFRYQAGDVLVVDNQAMGHGRMNVDAERVLHVALGGEVVVESLALDSAG